MNHAAGALISSDPSYYDAFRGSFYNLLQWNDLDSFWQALEQRADAGWYIYAIGEAAPQTPVSADQLRIFIREIDKLLREEHEEDYCGIVYVDNKTQPSFVKIYDPNNLGVTCGFSENPPLPGWVLSIMPPVELNEKTFLPQNRRRWWQRLFA